MIVYATLGTNNIEKSARFYDHLLATLGAERIIESDKFVAWSAGQNQPSISVTKPSNGESATVGNGTMVSLMFTSNEQVDRFYQKAIALGATCEGKPGMQGGAASYYAGYFRDLDGHKLTAFCMAKLN